MARRLGSTPFADLLPGSLSGDATVRAAAEALDSVLDATTRAIPTLLLYARLAHDTGFIEPVAMLPPLARLTEAAGGPAPLPDSLLDHLAWQLHVENYETAVDTPARRRLIAASLLLHRRRGTPWAVRTALESALSVPADVEDWFTYGGKPYFFRVILDVTQAGMDEARMADALRIIRTAKNVRSWLDYVRTLSRPSLTLRHAVGVATAGRVTIAPWMPGDAPPLSLRTACGAQAVTRITLRPWRPAPPAPRLTAAACPGLTGHTRVRIAPSHHAGVAHV